MFSRAFAFISISPIGSGDLRKKILAVKELYLLHFATRMARQKRETLIARLAPADRELIVGRAEKEGRSIGETIALVLRENQMLRAMETATV